MRGSGEEQLRVNEGQAHEGHQAVYLIRDMGVIEHHALATSHHLQKRYHATAKPPHRASISVCLCGFRSVCCSLCACAHTHHRRHCPCTQARMQQSQPGHEATADQSCHTLTHCCRRCGQRNRHTHHSSQPCDCEQLLAPDHSVHWVHAGCS